MNEDISYYNNYIYHNLVTNSFSYELLQYFLYKGHRCTLKKSHQFTYLQTGFDMNTSEILNNN